MNASRLHRIFRYILSASVNLSQRKNRIEKQYEKRYHSLETMKRKGNGKVDTFLSSTRHRLRIKNTPLRATDEANELIFACEFVSVIDIFYRIRMCASSFKDAVSNIYHRPYGTSLNRMCVTVVVGDTEA